MEKTSRKVNLALSALGAAQILSGAGAVLAIFLFASHEILEGVGEDIMMDGKVIQITALLLMSLVVVTGVLSLFKLHWGWIFSFCTATLILLMALLMGPGTIPITKWSFLGLMVLSLVNWAAAVVYYFHDLYT